jgi:hypothetical protein
MSTYKGRPNYTIDPPPYPQWWDYLNGAVVITILCASGIAVLSWMIGVFLTTMR